MLRGSSVLVFVATLALSDIASATYSIVGADSARREVGGSGTSCLGGQDVYVIYGSVPGTGVVHAQAQLNFQGRDRAVALLEQTRAPSEILAEITGASFDRNASVRQYAIVDVAGHVVAFTGEDTGVFASDQQGAIEGFVYSVQGNLLTGQRVLTQAAAGFEAGGCDLAERLMLALEAGADGGEGDSRCTDDGIPSDSAFVQVDREGEAAGAYLSLRVPTSGNETPLTALRALFNDWRATHACPAPMAGAGGGNAGFGGTGNAGAGSGGTSHAEAGYAGLGNAGPGNTEARNDGEGCGCRVKDRSSAGGDAMALLAIAFAVWRRRASLRA